MNTKLKSIFKTITLSLGALLLVTTATYAIGTLTPSGTAGDDTQYTLNDIYSKLTDFTDGATAGTGTSTIPGTITASFNTLSEIYALLEAEDSDLVPEKILAGTTIFGVEGTVVEGAPELEWSTDQGSMVWSTAVSTCAGTVDGSTGWRLPTIKEYQSITDFTMYNNATQVPGFAQYALYWSSTPVAELPDGAWYWDSYNGSIYYVFMVNSFSVRCVR